MGREYIGGWIALVTTWVEKKSKILFDIKISGKFYGAICACWDPFVPSRARVALKMQKRCGTFTIYIYIYILFIYVYIYICGYIDIVLITWFGSRMLNVWVLHIYIYIYIYQHSRWTNLSPWKTPNLDRCSIDRVIYIYTYIAMKYTQSRSPLNGSSDIYIYIYIYRHEIHPISIAVSM